MHIIHTVHRTAQPFFLFCLYSTTAKVLCDDHFLNFNSCCAAFLQVNLTLAGIHLFCRQKVQC